MDRTGAFAVLGSSPARFVAFAATGVPISPRGGSRHRPYGWFSAQQAADGPSRRLRAKGGHNVRTFNVRSIQEATLMRFSLQAAFVCATLALGGPALAQTTVT